MTARFTYALAAAMLAAAARDAPACEPFDRALTALALVTADGATLDDDGGVLVRRSEGRPGAAEAQWTVRTADGAAVAVEVEVLADGLERWRLAAPAARDLEIVDERGQVIAHLHEQSGRQKAMPAPRVRRLTSTGRPGRTDAVPGSHMALDLAADPPPGAVLLLAELVSDGQVYPSFTLAAPSTRHVERDTFARKSCADGPMPVVAGTRLRFTWIDATGRRSRPSAAIKVARQSR